MLAGSIRRDDRTLQVSAKVEDVRDQVVLWSGQLERPSGEAPALQVQAAARLANVLKCAAGAEQNPNAPNDAQTLSLYLQICDSDLSSTDLGQIEQVIDLLRQLVARAPRFSSAHANLAYVSVFTSDFFPPGQRAVMRQTARDEAEKAISLDPKSADAYTVLSLLAPAGRWAEREALLSRALSVDPNSSLANLWYGAYLTEVGRLQDALVYMQRAAAMNPFWLGGSNSSNAALALARVGQTIEADATMQRVLNDWPGGVAAIGSNFYLARWEGRFDDALSMVQQDGALNTILSDADRKTWQEVLPALSSRDPRRAAAERKSQVAFASRAPINLSFAIENLSQLGLLDDAFALADRLQSVRVPINVGVLFNPPAAAMRRDPRFIALAARLGLVDYWRSTGKWPDFCTEPGLPYDCKAEAAKVAGGRHG
jgi:tetratricopeptide (TPR) repeat protein